MDGDEGCKIVTKCFSDLFNFVLRFYIDSYIVGRSEHIQNDCVFKIL